MSNQKLLQHDIERELEGLTFNELIQIAMLINEMYSKSNGKPTLIFNMFNYTKESEQWTLITNFDCILTDDIRTPLH